MAHDNKYRIQEQAFAYLSYVVLHVTPYGWFNFKVTIVCMYTWLTHMPHVDGQGICVYNRCHMCHATSEDTI